MADILPMLERVLQVSKNLLIIAEDVDGEALATLAVNKLRGTINVVAVKAPGFGDRRKDNLGDLAALTGGDGDQRRAGPQAGLGCSSRTWAAPAASSSPRKRPRSSRAAAPEGRIEGRVEARSRRRSRRTTSDWDREKLQERLGKLAGSVAVIKVGAATEVELKEKKHRVEDALSARRAPRSRRASSPAVASPSSTPCPRWTSSQPRGRRAHRRQHPAARARGAAAPHRDQRRPGRLRYRPGGEDAASSARATTPRGTSSAT